MKILNKFIWSKTAPSNTNDIWFDGEVFRLYRPGYKEEEAWGAFTLPVDTAAKITKMLEDAFEMYQEKLVAGKGIKIENNTISTTSIFKLVNRLPEVGEEGIIYLRPFQSSNGKDNQLVEYIWRDIYWEKLGEFKSDVDLSEYVKKNELPTPDWNATSDQKGYIKNKPFGYTFNEKYITLKNSDVQDENPVLIYTFQTTYRPQNIIIYNHYTGYRAYNYNDLINGNYVDIPSYGPVITASLKEEDSNLYITFNNTFHGAPNTWTIGAGEINTISNEFIPDTIARKTDISNPDWNANEGEAGHIKNRTHGVVFDFKSDKINLKDCKIGDLLWKFNKHHQYLIYTNYDADRFDIIKYNLDEEYALLVNGPALYIKVSSISGSEVGVYLSRGSVTSTNNTIQFATNISISKLNDAFIPDTIARKSDIATINNQPITNGGNIEIKGGGNGGDKSQFQIYKENGGEFFTNENTYNIYSALKGNPVDKTIDAHVIPSMHVGQTYSFEDLNLSKIAIVGVLYYGVKLRVEGKDSDIDYTASIYDSTDTKLSLFGGSGKVMDINLIDETVFYHDA